VGVDAETYHRQLKEALEVEDRKRSLRGPSRKRSLRGPNPTPGETRTDFIGER
jgi:hypothetical protein